MHTEESFMGPAILWIFREITVGVNLRVRLLVCTDRATWRLLEDMYSTVVLKDPSFDGAKSDSFLLSLNVWRVVCSNAR